MVSPYTTSFIHPFIQHLFINYLPCTGDHCKLWRYNNRNKTPTPTDLHSNGVRGGELADSKQTYKLCKLKRVRSGVGSESAGKLSRKGETGMSAARRWHLRKEVKERKEEAGGLLKEEHPRRANNECKCTAWNSASSVWAKRRRKWDDDRVRIRGAVGDELRKEARDPSSRSLLGKVTEVDFIWNETAAIGEFWTEYNLTCFNTIIWAAWWNKTLESKDKREETIQQTVDGVVHPWW